MVPGEWLSAEHRALGRSVAVKQLPRAFAADAAVRRRFVSEGRFLPALDHPHIVPVFDFVEKDGLCLLVMELLPGGTVWSRFGAKGFTPPAACATVLAAASGLQAAHEKNVLHRDVKPENMMFSSEGVLKVTDFGIAKVVGGNATLATERRRSNWAPRPILRPSRPGAGPFPCDRRLCAGHNAVRDVIGAIAFSRRGRRDGAFVQACVRGPRTAGRDGAREYPSLSSPSSCEPWPPSPRTATAVRNRSPWHWLKPVRRFGDRVGWRPKGCR